MINEPYRIDVHHHVIPPDYVRALADIGVSSSLGLNFPQWSVESMLEMMDRNGIKAAITSISSPGVYFGDVVFAHGLARQCNETSARLITDYPQRVGAYATLPLPDTEAAMKEIEYTLDTLKLDGIVMLTNYAGQYLGNPVFEDVFSELNRRKAVVYVHPTDPPGKNPLGDHVPSFLMEVTFDTTRTIANLIFSGTLERYPDIAFIFAHAGGTVPFLAWRIAQGSYVWPRAFERAPKNVFFYLKRLYYDTGLSASPYALRSLQSLVDTSQVLFGSDYPFAPESIAVRTIKGIAAYDGFDAEAKKSVEQKNALRLFSRFE
jgi:predicted TIM-barrel fold metal-dependent hydrolase